MVNCRYNEAMMILGEHKGISSTDIVTIKVSEGSEFESHYVLSTKNLPGNILCGSNISTSCRKVPSIIKKKDNP